MITPETLRNGPAPPPPERDFRGPGCDGRCTVVSALLPGVFGRSDLLLHDPEPHEAYGRLEGAAGSAGPVRTGPLVVDVVAWTVTLDGRAIEPATSEMRLLMALARRAGALVSFDEAARAIWGPGFGGVPRASWRHSIRAHLARLRRRLHPAGWLVATVADLGLRLDVLPEDEPPPSPPPGRWAPMTRWARDYDACVDCHSTRLPHGGLGRCTTCYWHYRRRETP